MLKILTALGAAALAASTLSTPASAAPEDEVKIVVSYAGLDLSSPRDSARFDRRLRTAAREVCGEAPMIGLAMSREIAVCQEDVLARARADVRIAMRSTGQTLALRAN
jgi:UrcA family protein